jgi:hypothetical protein
LTLLGGWQICLKDVVANKIGKLGYETNFYERGGTFKQSVYIPVGLYYTESNI